MDSVNKLIILGGGTAGWMAAASLSHHLSGRGIQITLVESEAIGTVGVGEATIPSIRAFNDALGIDELEFIKSTQATFKLGIEFKNWRDHNTHFFHPFADYGIDLNGIAFHHYLTRARQMDMEVGELADYCFATQLAYRGRFAQPNPNPPSPLADYGYAFHFDAGRYALFLREYAQKRGVKRIEAKVTDVHQNPDTGYIESLALEGCQTLAGDFFIDCSGFRGLLIEQSLHTGYEDWRHWLPCDRAIAVQSERAGQPAPFTRSTAKDAGWQWRIPLQHRSGNGYVYASEFCDAQSARETLLADLEGEPINEPRSFEFVTGLRKKIWHKNCFALGLASGFLEPLESTSISLIQTGITKLLHFFPYRGINPWDRAEVNRQHRHEFERIRDFIILHYKASRRADTPFWRHCQSMDMPDSLQHKIKLFRSRGHTVMYPPEAFERDSWVSMYWGFGITPADYDRRADALTSQQLQQQLTSMRQTVAKAASGPLSHGEFIARHCAAPKP